MSSQIKYELLPIQGFTGGANNVNYYLYTYNGGPTTPKAWRDTTQFKIYY